MITREQAAEMQARLSKARQEHPLTPCFRPAEKNLQQEIAGYCRAHQWPFQCYSMAHRVYGTTGWPDFTIMGESGKVWFIECKRIGGKLRPEQAGIAMMAGKKGHTVHVVHSMTEFLEVVAGPIEVKE